MVSNVAVYRPPNGPRMPTRRHIHAVKLMLPKTPDKASFSDGGWTTAALHAARIETMVGKFETVMLKKQGSKQMATRPFYYTGENGLSRGQLALDVHGRTRETSPSQVVGRPQSSLSPKT